MSRLQVGIVRYLSVAAAIGKALGIEAAPYFQIGHGRITLTFRRLGEWCQRHRSVTSNFADVAKTADHFPVR